MLGRLIGAGYLPYRLGIQSAGLLPDPDDDTGRLLGALKKTLDPNNILAPGRYGLGGGRSHQRRRHVPESGVILGSVHVPPGRGRSLWFNGGLVKFYALGEDTGGAFTLFEESLAPQDRALPHLHHEEDQAFYVLEGEHEFVCDGRTFAAGAGSFFYVPRGTVHSYENVGTEPGRILILSAPAGGTERIFFELGESATEESPPPPTCTAGPRSVQGNSPEARLRHRPVRHVATE